MAKTAAEAKILVVGAGGIGCELLKNLVLSGYRDIQVVDLDTIDFSNLNRQFLFRKEHVGKSKALVAKESVLAFCPDAKITAIHDSIIKPEYNKDYFGTFDMVLNALDNRLARNHVNRLCLAANVPLVESGTQGYLGQVEPILKGVTECYECKPKTAARTFAGCTIRNTPSEPIHCIVWAKHLFNQLFGLIDADEDVSPDSTDPEAKKEGEENGGEKAAGDGADAVMKSAADEEKKKSEEEEESSKTDAAPKDARVQVSTREWAAERNYEPASLFDKLFHDDIVYLRRMENLWTKRRAPEPARFPAGDNALENWTAPAGLRDQRVWAADECAVAFGDSVVALRDRLAALGDGDFLTWDKDDDAALDFVTACANVRMTCFGMEPKTQFEIKSMAGNIIPAIATTNAVIAGAIVIQANKILRGEQADTRAVFLSRSANPSTNEVILATPMDKPNPKCYSCAEKSEVYVVANTKTSTMRSFRDKVLKEILNMSAPDVSIEGTSSIVISSEEGETDDLEERPMEALGMVHCARLLCDDFLQDFNVLVNVIHSEEKLKDGVEFEVQGELPKPKEEPTAADKDQTNGGASTSSNVIADDDDDDDIQIVESDDEEVVASAPADDPVPAKKARLS